MLVGVATFVVFLPALQNGFVNWDDDKNLLNNPDYRGLGWTHLRWMFTTFHMGHYQPLSWLTLGLDYLLWGMAPFGYHLTSLVLHAANAVLVYFLAARLLRCGASPTAGLSIGIAAAFSALFFALHPLRVESVAWATERRDVLSGFFFLSTILCYLKAVTGERTGDASWLGAAIACYALSLLSKASAMTLPAILLMLDIYPLRRLGDGSKTRFGSPDREILWEKIPFLSLALACAIIALLAQRQSEALRPLEQYDIRFRLAQAVFGLVFYLRKTVFPFGLAPLYQVPLQRNGSDWSFIVSGVAVASVSLILYLARRRWPAGLASWLYYGIVLAPVLGIAQSGPQLVADRYSYLSCLGWAILAGAGLLYGWKASRGGQIKPIAFLATGTAALVLAGLTILTWQQARIWHDSESLWRRALAIDQNSSIAHDNLGVALAERGEFAEAIQHYRRAIQISPGYVNPYNDLGLAHLARRELDEAVGQFRRAVEINPRYVMAHSNLGIALARKGELPEATERFRRAVQLNPSFAMGHYNLGVALAIRGDLEEALEHFRRALEIDPNYANAHYRLGTVLATRGRFEEAIEHYRRAVEIQPDFPAAKQALADALARRKR